MFDFDFALYINSFLAIASIHTAAVISPGPDVALTMRNSLLHSRKVGIFGALGTTTGMCIHLTYTVFGVGYLVVNMPWLMVAIQLAGAGYLLYLGYQSFKPHASPMKDIVPSDETGPKEVLTPFQAYRIGVINNLLNPIVILLFISILSAYITTETPFVIQGLYGVLMISITFAWFAFVAIFFSVDKIRLRFLKLGKWLERLTGGALIAFGLKIAYVVFRTF
tara:strand:- start:2929 stop:3594 length:666 start_codon:yes stop_codon:yes gene_type:complete